MPQELMKEFIGKVCTIILFNVIIKLFIIKALRNLYYLNAYINTAADEATILKTIKATIIFAANFFFSIFIISLVIMYLYYYIIL